MLRYVEQKILVKEIPDELSLGIFISGCPNGCPECHSKYAWDGSKGTLLSTSELIRIVYPNKRLISCILFMGGEWDSDTLITLIRTSRIHFTQKIGLYSGLELDELRKVILKDLDYLKVGRYDSKLGGLDSPTTNQRFYKIVHMDNENLLIDKTYKFWRDNG